MTIEHTTPPADNVPTVTLSLFGYSGSDRVWAFTQMGLARASLSRTTGLRFWRLVGSGRGAGFSLRPDWSRYGLLAVWNDESNAHAFFERAPFPAAVRARADEVWTVRLAPTASRGAWGGSNPFQPTQRAVDDAAVAVLTRAAIRWRRLGAFWGAVPATSRAVESADGLVASIGIGEAPLVRQATFSIWRDERALRAYAYATDAHREAIRRTRDERWYSEDLFARFSVVAAEGTWNGRNPLEGLL